MAGYYIPLVGTPQIGDSGGGGGSGGGGLLVIVTQQGEAQVCDKTAGEMAAVIEAGGSVVFKIEDEGSYLYVPLGRAAIASVGYYFFAAGMQFTADSADDYPIANGSD